MAAVLVELVIVLAITLFVIYITPRLVSYWRFFKALGKIPSAYGCVPIFGNLLQFKGPRHRILPSLQAMHKKSKTPYIVWLGLIPILILVEPKHVEVILGNPKYINKPSKYRFGEEWLGKGLITSNGSKWFAHRKLIQPAFHMQMLERFLEDFIKHSKILVRELEKEVGSSSFNIWTYIVRCTMATISATAMGLDLNSLEEKEQIEYVEATHKMTSGLVERVMRPWLYPDILYKMSTRGRTTAKYNKILQERTKLIIKERMEDNKKNKPVSRADDDDAVLGQKKKQAFLDLLLENLENGTLLTDKDLRDEVNTFMAAGHDTLAAVLSWSLYVLSSNPEVQEKVFEEQQSIFDGRDDSPKMKDISEMKYLDRVLKETMRMYAHVPFLGRELQEEIQLDGYTIPAGTEILICTYVTHHLEEFYPNPEVFDPDRFLPENIATRHPYSYLPFSAGPRNCIGQRFSMLQAKVVLSYIVRHYELEATTGMPVLVPDIMNRAEDGVHVKIIKRIAS